MSRPYYRDENAPPQGYSGGFHSGPAPPESSHGNYRLPPPSGLLSGHGTNASGSHPSSYYSQVTSSMQPVNHAGYAHAHMQQQPPGSSSLNDPYRNAEQRPAYFSEGYSLPPASSTAPRSIPPTYAGQEASLAPAQGFPTQPLPHRSAYEQVPASHSQVYTPPHPHAQQAQPWNTTANHQLMHLLPGSRTAEVPNLIDTDRAHAIKGIKFRLTMRQQPRAARACGSGERDRRNIDPPPIVQLHIESDEMEEDEKNRYLRYEGYVMNCWIYDQTGSGDASHMPSEYRYQRRLTGSLVGTPFYGKDDRGQDGCFFPFSDLSVRTLGRYRLKFNLIMLDTTTSARNKHFPNLAEVFSEVFDVYTAKEFPGISESSRLVRTLREQGCIIAIKKGNEKRKKGKGKEGDSDEDDEGEGDEDDGDDGDGGEGGSQKRRRSIVV